MILGRVFRWCHCFAVRRAASRCPKSRPMEMDRGYKRAASFCSVARIMRNCLGIHNHVAWACHRPKFVRRLLSDSAFLLPHLSLPSQRQPIALHGALLHCDRPLTVLTQTIVLIQTSFPRTIQVAHVSQAHARDACLHLQSGGVSISKWYVLAKVYPSLIVIIPQCYSDEVTKSIKVNTRTMRKVELACLFHLVGQVDLLDYHKPNTMIFRLRGLSTI